MRYLHIIFGFLTISVFGSFVLGGCAKDYYALESSSTQQLITYSPATSISSTKGNVTGIIQDGTFPDTLDFASTVFYLPHDEDGAPSFNTGGHFISFFERVWYSDETWQTSSLHYWPLSGACYFVSFYPTLDTLRARKMISGGMGASYGSSYEGFYADRQQNFYLTNYTITHTDESNNTITADDDKTDLNLSRARVDLMSNAYLLENVQKRASNSVPIAFEHGLTQIRFTFETAGDYSCMEKSHIVIDTTNKDNPDTSVWYWLNYEQFWVDEIKLTNVYSKGCYSLSAPHWPSDSLKEVYTYYPLKRETSAGTQAVYSSTVKSTLNPSKDSIVLRNSFADVFYFGRRTPIPNFIKNPELPYDANEQYVSSDDALSVLLIPQRFPQDAELVVTLSSRVMNILSTGISRTGQANRVMNDYKETYTKTFSLSDICPVITPGESIVFRLVLDLDDISVNVSYSNWQTDTDADIVL